MGHYIYDGTFYGLMTTIARILDTHDSPSHIRPVQTYTPDLFAEPIRIETVEFVAEDLLFQIRNEISELAYDHVVYTFLSEHANCEMILHHYIQRGFVVGKKIDRMLTDKWVLKTHALTRKVAREVFRYKGFVRFSRLADAFYYAAIEPEYDILPLLAPHFVKRLTDQSWIIHDVKRHKAAIYNKKDICISDISLLQDLVFAPGDEEHKRLWQCYYDTIGITARANPKLRQQLMPKKHQKYLVELQTTAKREIIQMPRNDHLPAGD